MNKQALPRHFPAIAGKMHISGASDVKPFHCRTCGTNSFASGNVAEDPLRCLYPLWHRAFVPLNTSARFPFPTLLQGRHTLTSQPPLALRTTHMYLMITRSPLHRSQHFLGDCSRFELVRTSKHKSDRITGTGHHLRTLITAPMGTAIRKRTRTTHQILLAPLLSSCTAEHTVNLHSILIQNTLSLSRPHICKAPRCHALRDVSSAPFRELNFTHYL